MIGDPLVSGLCLALFGAGRALAAVALGPRSLERVVAAAGPVRRLNAAALGSLAALLLLAPAAGAAVVPLGPGSYSEPSASGGVLAYAEASGAGGTAVVRAGGKTGAARRGRLGAARWTATTWPSPMSPACA